MDQLLAKLRKIAKLKHHPAVQVDHVGAFVADLRGIEGLSVKALNWPC